MILAKVFVPILCFPLFCIQVHVLYAFKYLEEDLHVQAMCTIVVLVIWSVAWMSSSITGEAYAQILNS
jgi:hypothetical protein